MADDERNLPPGVQDVLAHMPREMRRRVLADYETHYAPFLSMLAGWKGAVQEHYVQSEAASVARLEEEFFPLGNWQFPAQAIAIPQRPPPRTTDVTFGSPLTDPTNNPWITSGEGWLQPTLLREFAVRWAGNDCIVTLDADYLATGSVDPILERGQLAFVAAPEEALEALERGTWWVFTPAGKPRSLCLTRYDGYMDFEREIQTARMNQRHLDLWLPPFYPYSRKIVCLRLSENSPPAPPEIEQLGRDLKTGFRCIGLISSPAARPAAALRTLTASRREGSPVALNAVPVVQTAVADTVFYPPFPRLGHEHALRMTGVPSLFAASVRQDGRAVPASLIRLPSPDPLAAEPDVQVQFPQTGANVTQVKLYHGSLGAKAAQMLDLPSVLEKAPLRFTTPYPLLGGVSVGGPKDRAEWVRTAWYQSVLRPPLLSEGDLVEIIRQRQANLGEMLRFRSAARRIVHDANFGEAHWRSYLWPSLIARQESFSAGGEIPTPDSMPLIQSLILTFERSVGTTVPDFLLTDMANYLASVLSQYFVLSTFQIEGQVV
ncbi:MAG: hypothetical protein ACRYFS_01540 [Janthinobacterium lividum]